MSIHPTTRAAVNVVAGWLGHPIPPIPKHRNQSRAGYRKTPRKREPRRARDADVSYSMRFPDARSLGS